MLSTGRTGSPQLEQRLVPPNTSPHGRVSQSSPYSFGSSSATGRRSMTTQMNEPIASEARARRRRRGRSAVVAHPLRRGAGTHDEVGRRRDVGIDLVRPPSPAISSGCTEAAMASS